VVDESAVVKALKTVYDVEIPVNVYDLGLIREIRVDGSRVYVKMTWTSPLCPYGPLMTKMVEDAIRGVKGVKEVSVDVELDPPWTPEELTEEGRKQMEMLFGKDAVTRWLDGGR